MNKAEARKYALANRKHEDNMNASKNVVNDILRSNILSSFSNIAIYYPIGKEIDVTKLLEQYPDKRFYLPITRDEIYFCPYSLNDELFDAPFKTKEPKGEIVDRKEIDCFIIPCVAITNKYKRIGYGKGYYDRYLDGYQGFKIGICYKSGFIECEADDYDVVLDKIFLG